MKQLHFFFDLKRCRKGSLMLLLVLYFTLMPSLVSAQEEEQQNQTVGEIEFGYTTKPGDTVKDTLVEGKASMQTQTESTVLSNTACTKIGNASRDCSTAPPFNPATARQDMIDKFQITFDGFDNAHLEWAWKMLWRLSSTKFVDYIVGSHVKAINERYSYVQGCKNVFVNQYTPEEVFVTILTHEFGHVVRGCNDMRVIKKVEHEQARDQEGGVSPYGRLGPACVNGVNLYDEDYAETVAYYLNPGATKTWSSPKDCGPAEDNPFKDGGKRFPKHYNIGTTVFGPTQGGGF